MQDLFHSKLNREELGDILFDSLQWEVGGNEAWRQVDELERKGRAALVRAIEDRWYGKAV